MKSAEQPDTNGCGGLQKKIYMDWKTDLVNQHGPDSLIAKIGATMLGSTATTFYVLAVYYGSVGIRKTRQALMADLIADTVGIISAVYVCRLFFG